LTGFTVKDSPCCSAACCGIGPYVDFIDCETSTSYCNNREEYIFWDLFHPTERVNILAQQQFLKGGLDVVSPMNVAQLVNF
jgi:phospholipase/lecithinase/hemolysin